MIETLVRGGKEPSKKALGEAGASVGALRHQQEVQSVGVGPGKMGKIGGEFGEEGKGQIRGTLKSIKRRL